MLGWVLMPQLLPGWCLISPLLSAFAWLMPGYVVPWPAQVGHLTCTNLNQDDPYRDSTIEAGPIP